MKYKLLISILLCNVQITKSMQFNPEAVLLSLIDLFNGYKGPTLHFLSADNSLLVTLSANQEPAANRAPIVRDECHDAGPIMSKARRKLLEKKIIKNLNSLKEEDSWVIIPSNK